MLDLALRVGVAQSTITRLEHDDYAQIPKPDLTQALSRELGIPEVSFLTAAGYRVSDADPPDDDATEIARVIARWTPAQRRWLLDLMQRTDAMLGDDDDDEASA